MNLNKKNKKNFTFVAPLGQFFAIALLDYWVSYRINLSILYLIPILGMTRGYGTKAGVAASLVASAAWLLSDIASGHPYAYGIYAFWNVLVRFGFFIVIVFLFSLWNGEKKAARKDVLTQASNRRAFQEFAELELARSRRFKRPISLIYLDVDNFKSINDRYGHKKGDEILTAVAGTLMRATREMDKVARMGGDEFVILLPETSQEAARLVVSRIQEIFEVIRANIWPVTLSMGAVTFTRPPASIQEMIGKADRLLYESKKSGKNHVEFEVIDEQLAQQRAF